MATVTPEFRAKVQAGLVAEGHNPELTTAELALCAIAVEYGVGPGDTACQIIDNRTPDPHATPDEES